MRVSRIARSIQLPCICDEAPFFFRQFFDPDTDQPFETTGGKIRESCVLSKFVGFRRGVGRVWGFDKCELEFQTTTKLLCKTRKLLLTGKRAKDDKNLLPILQVGILHDVRQIIGHDRLEETEVWQSRRATFEISPLRALQ
jgi:hypothetical protein